MAGHVNRKRTSNMIDGTSISLIESAAQLGSALLALSLALLLPAGALRLRCP